MLRICHDMIQGELDEFVLPTHIQQIIDFMQGDGIMDTLCLILAIIGAVNWGLVGFARFDLVAWIFGGQTAGVSRVIYAVVGIAGLWCTTMLFRKKGRQEA